MLLNGCFCAKQIDYCDIASSPMKHEVIRVSLLRQIMLFIYSFDSDNTDPYRQIYRPTWTDQTSETGTRESYLQQPNYLLFG